MNMDNLQSTNFAYGIIFVLGFLIVILWKLSSIIRSQAFMMFSDYLNRPDSELNRHKHDANAHEMMRNAMYESFDERFNKLEQMVLAGNQIQSEELKAFKEQSLDPVVALSNRVVDLLDKQLEIKKRD